MKGRRGRDEREDDELHMYYIFGNDTKHLKKKKQGRQNKTVFKKKLGG